MLKMSTNCIFFLFLGLSTKSLETYAIAFVCSFVSHAVSRKPFIIFSETLQLVRACKRDKNDKKFPFLLILAKKCPKFSIFARKWRFLLFHNPFIRIRYFLVELNIIMTHFKIYFSWGSSFLVKKNPSQQPK